MPFKHQTAFVYWLFLPACILIMQPHHHVFNYFSITPLDTMADKVHINNPHVVDSVTQAGLRDRSYITQSKFNPL